MPGRKRRRAAQALLAVVLGLVLAMAQALTLSQAIKKVQRQTDGKVLSARTIVERNREIHVIRVLTPDGRVRQIRVPGDRVKRGRDDPNARPGR